MTGVQTCALPILISSYKFYIESPDYTNVSLNIETPAIAAFYVDGSRKSIKSQANDSIRNIKELKGSFNMEPGTKEIIIKTLSTEKNIEQPTLKINLITSDSVDINVSTLNKFLPTVEKMMTGDRFSELILSPDSKYAIVSIKSVKDNGNTSFNKYIFDLKTGKRTYINKNWNRLKWSPTSSNLLYMIENGKNHDIHSFNPATDEDILIAENVPNNTFYMNNNEEYIIFSIPQSDNKPASNGLTKLNMPDDRIRNSNSSANLYLYSLKNKNLKQITFGHRELSLKPVRFCDDIIYFSETKNLITDRALRTQNLYSLNIKTNQLDTLYKDAKFVNSAYPTKSGDGLIITGSAEAFDKIGRAHV